MQKFLNLEYGVIGRSVSTINEPNTSSEFLFWVADRDEAQGKIEIGNIVAAYSDDENDVTFGIVTEMRSYSDVDSFIADYLSHDFGDAEIDVPTDISEVIVVTCAVMRNVSSKTKPLGRSRIYFPSILGIQFAYGIVDEEGDIVFRGAAIPLGVFENGDGTIAPVSIDQDFLVGPEGAHLNVTGISGLATKTSAVEFTIKSLLTYTSSKIGVVMFNVKSRDLLYIDQLNSEFQEISDAATWSRQAYEALEIPLEPFDNARFFAPAKPSDPNKTMSLRELKTERFQWDLQMIYEDIPSLFSPMDWDDKMEGVWQVIQEEIEAGNLLTYTQMTNWINKLIKNAGPRQQWLRGGHIATWAKMRSHIYRFPRSYQGLLATGGYGKDIPWEELVHGEVFVIDMQMLNDRGKRLVFGRTINTISKKLENEELDLEKIVIFVDELNKFAPAGNVRSPLKDRLIDITARGRSLGLVLFGAEQFASSVDKQIVENSSTFLFGRTESNELRNPNYAAFSDEVKTKLTMLPQGQLLVKFAKFPQPIFIRFPYPPCLPGDAYESSG